VERLTTSFGKKEAKRCTISDGLTTRPEKSWTVRWKRNAKTTKEGEAKMSELEAARKQVADLTAQIEEAERQRGELAAKRPGWLRLVATGKTSEVSLDRDLTLLKAKLEGLKLLRDEALATLKPLEEQAAREELALAIAKNKTDREVKMRQAEDAVKQFQEHRLAVCLELGRLIVKLNAVRPQGDYMLRSLTDWTPDREAFQIVALDANYIATASLWPLYERGKSPDKRLEKVSADLLAS
jgi:chromosome segregation ATPase